MNLERDIFWKAMSKYVFCYRKLDSYSSCLGITTHDKPVITLLTGLMKRHLVKIDIICEMQVTT